MQTTPLKKTIAEKSSQCVKCGLCLPHCPTYLVTQNEGESPRGRIALMENYANNTLPLTDTVQNYLDHCLTCRACEAVCPAHVEYGELIDTTRAAFQTEKNYQKKFPRLLDLVIKHPGFSKLAANILRFYQCSGLRTLTQKTGLLKLLRLKKYDDFLPPIKKIKTWQPFYKAIHKERGRVALLTGCITNLIDQTTLSAAIKVLTHSGYGVYIPTSQRCCGALHQHAGLIDTSTYLIAKNKSAFEDLPIEAIISVATGCTATLVEHEKTLNKKVIDISEFLLTHPWPSDLTLAPLAKRVAIHIPCTQRNVLKQTDSTQQLLRKIPQIELFSLSDHPYCCGAAGLYMIEHGDMSKKLLDNLAINSEVLEADFVVTSNIGCQLQFTNTLKNKGSNAIITHPIILLAQQINPEQI